MSRNTNSRITQQKFTKAHTFRSIFLAHRMQNLKHTYPAYQRIHSKLILSLKSVLDPTRILPLRLTRPRSTCETPWLMQHFDFCINFYATINEMTYSCRLFLRNIAETTGFSFLKVTYMKSIF